MRHFVQFLEATTWQYIEHIFFAFTLAISSSYLGHILRISWAYLHIHIHILISWSSQLGQKISLFSKKILSSLPTITYFLLLKLSDFPFFFLLDNFIQNWGMDFESQMCFQLHLKNLCQSNSTNLTPKFFWPTKLFFKKWSQMARKMVKSLFWGSKIKVQYRRPF